MMIAGYLKPDPVRCSVKERPGLSSAVMEFSFVLDSLGGLRVH